MFAGLREDVRHGLRLLARKPGFTLLVVLALSLAIGANTAIFSIVDAVLFHPLSVPRAADLWRLIPVHEHAIGWSYPGYRDLVDGVPAAEAIAAWGDPTPAHLVRASGPPVRVSAGLVSGNFFAVLGVRPFFGRLLTDADDAAEAPPVLVLSHRLWRERFGADREVVGRTARVNGRSYTIVGVAPPRFTGASLEAFPDLWAPLSETGTVMASLAELKPLTRRGFSWLNVVFQLPPGAAPTQAEAQALAIAMAPHGDEPQPEVQGVRLVPAGEAALGVGTQAAGRTRVAGRLLFGVVILVLALACANVAGMLIVRGERRGREIAIRRAIGASRVRLLRQFLVESAILGALAAAGGLLLAAWTLDLVRVLVPRGLLLPFDAVAGVGDPRVLLWTLAVSLATVLVLGLAPALRASRVDVSAALAHPSAARTAAGARLAAREMLVAIQVALAVVLLAGAGLLLRTLGQATAVDPGYEAAQRLTASIDPGLQGYDRNRTAQFYGSLLEAARALPGVRSAALAYVVPIDRRSMASSVEYEGYTGTPDDAPIVPFNVVTPGFFRTMGIPLLRGRDFEAGDSASSREVVIVNEAFARKYWPNQDPLGRVIRNLGEKGGLVVGVVRDARLRSPRTAPEPYLFLPLSQFGLTSASLVVQTEGNPAAALPSLAAAVARLDPDLPLYDAVTLADKLRVALGQETLLASLLGLFSVIALILAGTGVYGVTAFSTEARTREFGIRIALGAPRRHVLGLVLRRTAWLALGGAVAGLAGVAWLGRVFQSLLFGVGTGDPLALAGSLLLIAAATLVACVVPARRATRVDPLVALRCE